jgi:type I restriction enzyme S subunit
MSNVLNAAGWPTARLADIAKLCSGGTPSRKRSDFFAGEIPWLTGQDIPEGRVSDISKGRDYVTEDAVKGSATRIVPENTVLVTTRVTVGKTGVTTRPLCFSQDVTGIILRSPEIALPHFVAYFLLSQRQKLLQRNQGSTIAGVTRDSLALERIPLPPLSEQRRIVEILEEAEQVRQLCDSADERKAKLVASLFQSMFRQPTKVSAWPEVTVSEIADDTENSIRTGPFGSDLLHSEFVGEGIPVLGIDNAVQNRFGWAERRFITREKFASLKRFRVFPGDVMVTIMGTVGRAAVAPVDLPECISTKHLCVITPDQSRILPLFLWATLLFDPFVRAQSSAEGKGAIMEGLNSKIIRRLRFRLPPVDLQSEFTRAVEEALLIEDRYSSSRGTITELSRSVLAHAFSGRLTADWRESARGALQAEAVGRDAALRATSVTTSGTARITAALAVVSGRRDGAHAELTREQQAVLEAAQRRNNSPNPSRWFTAEELAKNFDGPLRGHRHAIEVHLGVLAARGLVIAVSCEEPAPMTGEIVYGNAYRLPLDEFQPKGDDPREPVQGERARLRGLERLAALLRREPS